MLSTPSTIRRQSIIPKRRRLVSMIRTTSQDTLYTDHTITLSKPMGLILEENEGDDDDSSHSSPSLSTVSIVAMEGEATLASQRGEVDICIGDGVVKIENTVCEDWTLEQVMGEIISQTSPVTLTARRASTVIPIKFLHNGVCVPAKPGMSIGALGRTAKAPITYSCRNGGCGTCQHVMLLIIARGGNNANVVVSERFVRPCVGTVPRGVQRITIIPCDQYDGSLLV